MDDAVIAANAALDVVLDTAYAELGTLTSGLSTPAARYASVVDIVDALPRFVGRPMQKIDVSNDAQQELYPNHPDPVVKLAVVRALLGGGQSQHEKVRLVVRQVLIWSRRTVVDPASLSL